MSQGFATEDTDKRAPGLKQPGRGTEGDLNLGASSTTGNEDDSGTLFVGDAGGGSQLGAASGVDAAGTAGAPPASPGGGDGTMEMDWGPAGPGKGVSGTEGQAHAGPTHPATGYDTARTTGGFVQHPNDSALGLAHTGGGTGVSQNNQEIAASEGSREAIGGSAQARPAGSGDLGGGQSVGGGGPKPIQDDAEAGGDAFRSAT